MNNSKIEEDEIFDKKDVSFIFSDFDNENKINRFKQVFIFILFPTFFWLKVLSGNRTKKNKALKEKLRYFNPTIKEGFLSNTVTWVGREKPLNDDELDNLCNYR